MIKDWMLFIASMGWEQRNSVFNLFMVSFWFLTIIVTIIVTIILQNLGVILIGFLIGILGWLLLMLSLLGITMLSDSLTKLNIIKK